MTSDFFAYVVTGRIFSRLSKERKMKVKIELQYSIPEVKDVPLECHVHRIVFRIVEAEWPQCRRCQALSYWGSGNLEWVG